MKTNHINELAKLIIGFWKVYSIAFGCLSFINSINYIFFNAPKPEQMTMYNLHFFVISIFGLVAFFWPESKDKDLNSPSK